VSLAALKALGFGQFVVGVLIAAALSLWIYWHASRHGSRHATAWGLATFLFALVVVPAYFLHYYATRRRL
jgi:hypothetical protein